MNPKTVLVVDDVAEIRVAMCALLQDAGYSVIEADNGAEGIRCAREHQPDLILMDLGMPGLDGRQATAQLKSDSATDHIPVLAATGRVLFREDRDRLCASGFSACLHKPVPPALLLEHIQQRIGPTASTTLRPSPR